jgi:hypothetical protein
MVSEWISFLKPGHSSGDSGLPNIHGMEKAAGHTSQRMGQRWDSPRATVSPEFLL